MSPLTLIPALSVILLAWGVVAAGTRRSLRVHRIERKLDALIADADLQDRVFPRVSGQVSSLIQQKRIPEAIKAYRTENAGLSLKDAHDVISGMASPENPRRADLDRIDRKLDVLLEAHGLRQASEIRISDAARLSVQNGDLIDGIRMLRADNKGLTLAEAREIARGLR